MTHQNGRRDTTFLLWFAFLAPLVGWFAQLNASFLLISYACSSEKMWIVHSITFAALVLAAAGLWAGWRSKKLQKEQRQESAQGKSFLTALTLAFGAILFLVILAGEFSNLILEPCL